MAADFVTVLVFWRVNFYNHLEGSGRVGGQNFPISGVRLFTNMLSDLDGHYFKGK